MPVYELTKEEMTEDIERITSCYDDQRRKKIATIDYFISLNKQDILELKREKEQLLKELKENNNGR